jgi:hypothetical protein
MKEKLKIKSNNFWRFNSWGLKTGRTKARKILLKGISETELKGERQY